MAKITIVEAINSALNNEMARDPRVMLIGEDIGYDGGVFRATDKLIDKFGPDRVVDTPLAESGLIGSAIGLCMVGFVPVTEVQFMGFLYPGIDQLAAHAARMRNRTRGRYTCPMVVRFPYGGGIHAPEHHSESYEAMLVNTPGLKVVVPSSPYDAKGLLISAIRDPDPVVFMEPKRIYRAIRGEVPDKAYTIPLGKANVVKEGSDISVFCYGATVRQVMKVAEKHDKSIEVVDLRTLSPLDYDTILTSAKKTGRVVIVHEAPRSCGVGAEIAAKLASKALLSLEAPIERVTGFDTVFPLYKNEHLYLPDEFKIKRAIDKVLNF